MKVPLEFIPDLLARYEEEKDQLARYHAEKHGENDDDEEKGAIGYILLWLMGVPASVLFFIFILRGCT